MEHIRQPILEYRPKSRLCQFMQTMPQCTGPESPSISRVWPAQNKTTSSLFVRFSSVRRFFSGISSSVWTEPKEARNFLKLGIVWRVFRRRPYSGSFKTGWRDWLELS
jgi:hypothetical protein